MGYPPDQAMVNSTGFYLTASPPKGILWSPYYNGAPPTKGRPDTISLSEACALSIDEQVQSKGLCPQSSQSRLGSKPLKQSSGPLVAQSEEGQAAILMIAVT